MNKVLMFGTTASLFALVTAAAYFFDPRNGKRRLITARDKTLRAVRKTKAAWRKTEHDLANRATGMFAQWRALKQTPHPDDRKLEGRIRAKLGRLVSHPHSIQVLVENRFVTLKGLVLAEESERLLQTVRVMTGIQGVQDELIVCNDPAHISGLQGGRSKQPKPWLARTWPPALRAGAIAAGTAGLAYGVNRRDEAGFLIALLSTGVALKGILDVVWGVQHEAIRCEETIRIRAPLSDVFDFWCDPRNYPRAMSHVLKVEKTGENLYHWTVSGPAGATVGWDATITDKVPNTLLSWKSIEGSMVKNEGTAFLDPVYDGSTRLHLRMWYQPPGGLAGRVLAAALGSDPARIIKTDLHQFKLGMERADRLRDEAKHRQAG